MNSNCFNGADDDASMYMEDKVRQPQKKNIDINVSSDRRRGSDAFSISFQR